MSPAAHGNTNRSTHAAVRDLVSMYLDAEGIATTAKRTPTGLSDSLSDDAIDPDLALDGVDLRVTSRLRPFRLSEDLESITGSAALRGVDVAAVVQWRSERAISDAFVVTSLRDFAKLISRST
jgi:hypothetical protein